MEQLNINWFAGLIDAEGSFCVLKQNGINRVDFSLSLTNYLPIKYLCDYFGVRVAITKPTGECKSYSYRLRLGGINNISKILNDLQGKLITKNRHLQCMINIVAIIKKHVDNHNYTYNIDDKITLRTNINALNKLNSGLPNNDDLIQSINYEWLAGLIDGDGSINISNIKSKNNRRKHRLCLKISMNDEYTIACLANMWHKNYSTYTSKNPNRKPCHTIRLVSHDAIDIINKCHKYLSLKKQQAELAILYQNNKLIDPDLCDVLADKITTLNRRPINRIGNNLINKLKQSNINVSYISTGLSTIVELNNRLSLEIRGHNNDSRIAAADIMLYEDEIDDKYAILIKHKLQLNDVINKLRPQQCTIKLINHNESSAFYNSYHYIGQCVAKYHLGIFYQDLLIACMSISHPSRQLSGDWEIKRMVIHSDYKIFGLWSFLMKWIIKNKLICGKLVSFSDNRLMSGLVYEKMGLVLESNNPFDYYWCKDGVRHHKSKLRKNINDDKSLTENELRIRQGYHKVWDYGKTKYSINI